MNLLDDYNKAVREEQKRILEWGLKKRQGNWWARNYIKLSIYATLIITLVISYYAGWLWPFRLIAIALFYRVVRYLWIKIKKAWVFIVTWYQAKKLLKQAFHLKRE